MDVNIQSFPVEDQTTMSISTKTHQSGRKLVLLLHAQRHILACFAFALEATGPDLNHQETTTHVSGSPNIMQCRGLDGLGISSSLSTPPSPQVGGETKTERSNSYTSNPLSFASPLLQETVEPIRDSPLFRATLSELGEKCANLRKSVKAVIKATEKYRNQLAACTNSRQYWQDAVASLCAEDPLRPLLETYFSRKRKTDDECSARELDLLQHQLLVPLNALNRQLKQGDAIQRTFAAESKRYYEIENKVCPAIYSLALADCKLQYLATTPESQSPTYEQRWHAAQDNFSASCFDAYSQLAVSSPASF